MSVQTDSCFDLQHTIDRADELVAREMALLDLLRAERQAYEDRIRPLRHELRDIEDLQREANAAHAELCRRGMAAK